jgi:hypothetical protein
MSHSQTQQITRYGQYGRALRTQRGHLEEPDEGKGIPWTKGGKERVGAANEFEDDGGQGSGAIKHAADNWEIEKVTDGVRQRVESSRMVDG